MRKYFTLGTLAYIMGTRGFFMSHDAINKLDIMNYIFNSNLFTDTGSPASYNVSLSSSDNSIVIDGLSAYNGIAFNPISMDDQPPGQQALKKTTIQGNTLRIANAYSGNTFALIKADRSATLFTFLSSGGAAAVPTESTNNYTYPELHRLSVLGYV